MLVYIHVPFCSSRCNYCAFHSMPLAGETESSRAELIQTYLDSLLLELAHYGDKMGGKSVRSVFFGGGTPSILPPRAIGVIMERLRRYFKLSPKAEITLEANPESLRERGKTEDYLACGINRISLGLQSLDDGVLRMLGRPHKGRDSINAVFTAREAGFTNINIDLMWGLPGQSMRQWLQTLKEAITLGPDHISPYGLTLEPGTAMEKECEAGTLVLPPERDQSIMYMEGAAFLEANGFLQYEISNFARMGFQCRHNMGYWEGHDYLGLGPSSTSTISSRRWTNPASLNVWAERAKQGNLDSMPELLTPRTRILELIMLRLRTARGLRLKAYRDLTGHDFVKDQQKMIQAMHENGLIRIRNGYLSLTRSGMLVSNAILANIFESVENALRNETLPIKGPAKEDKAIEEVNIAAEGNIFVAGEARSAENESVKATPVIWPRK